MRHGTAEASRGRDHARPLTRRGKDDAYRVGQWLASEADVMPDRIVCSSALRCRETSQALSAGLGRSLPVEFEDRIYNAPAEALLDSLIDHAADSSRLEPAPEEGTSAQQTGASEAFLLIAHNPGISQLALELAGDLGEDSPLRSGFAPATTAVFEISAPWSRLGRGDARLTHFKDPGDF